ncbi:hypothetical protein [Vibrio tritonius]
MPFLFYPLIAGAVGFGAGFFTGSSTNRVLVTAAVVGAGVWAYKNVGAK